VSERLRDVARRADPKAARTTIQAARTPVSEPVNALPPPVPPPAPATTATVAEASSLTNPPRASEPPAVAILVMGEEPSVIWEVS
jgi:hypothetical protein